MHRKLNEKEFRGILNDYDRAIDLRENDMVFNPQLQERTGTLAFLALDLMNVAKGRTPPKHIVRFDFESMLYVFIWDAATDGKQDIPDPLIDWLSVASAKANLASELMMDIISLGRMEPVRHLLAKVALLLSDGHNSRLHAMALREEFDNETLGGHFTYEKFAAIVEEMKDILRALGWSFISVKPCFGSPDWLIQFRPPRMFSFDR